MSPLARELQLLEINCLSVFLQKKKKKKRKRVEHLLEYYGSLANISFVAPGELCSPLFIQNSLFPTSIDKYIFCKNIFY
ncbi:unnamed protein product [Ixodes pacificus]